MKKLKFFTMLLLAVGFVACGGDDSGAENLSDLQNGEENNADLPGVECEKSDINDWDNFLGISYGANELELEDIIGEFTGGEYTSDSSAFIYYFKRVERAPVSVWVNGETGDVETIFMEILGYEEYFDGDIEDAQDEYGMKDCDARFFGMSPDEVLDIMGEPARDEMKDDDVRSISYDSEDFLYSVNFKFYPSQGNKCSSISVNWFY